MPQGGKKERRAAVVVAHGPEHKKVVSLYPIIQGWAELNGFPLPPLPPTREGGGARVQYQHGDFEHDHFLPSPLPSAMKPTIFSVSLVPSLSLSLS